MSIIRDFTEVNMGHYNIVRKACAFIIVIQYPMSFIVMHDRDLARFKDHVPNLPAGPCQHNSQAGRERN
jgi:hypothetical protein